jgi:hypothetical protein
MGTVDRDHADPCRDADPTGVPAVVGDPAAPEGPGPDDPGPDDPGPDGSGGPGGRGGPATAQAGLARRVAAATAVLAAAVVVVAIVEPSPGRHARGLLLSVAFVLAVGVASAWVRVVRAQAHRTRGGPAGCGDAAGVE